METDDVTLLQRWAAAWTDLVAFEIVPVATGKDVAEALAAEFYNVFRRTGLNACVERFSSSKLQQTSNLQSL